MPWSVGIRFSHASLQVLAEDHAVDLLHIKGPAVDDSLLEAQAGAAAPGEPVGTVARASIDADVLVRPAHVARLVVAMHEHGWTTAYRFEDGSAFEHAATMTHPFLAPVDVHRRFPGISVDAEAAFERLWADRHSVFIAGLECPVPSVTAQRLVLIIHAARGGAGPDNPDIVRSWTDATAEERAAVRGLADELGAEVALAAGTGRLEEYRGARGYELWQALTTGEASLVRMWVARVKSEPTRRAALRTAVRLALPKPHRLEVTLGRPATAREIARAYWQRARRGGREVRELLRHRVSGPWAGR